MRRVAAIVALALLAACSRGNSGAQPAPSASARDALPARLLATGTEPFWSARIAARTIEFSLADPNNARKIDVMRASMGEGIVLRGTADGLPVTAQVIPGDCSDGMSERAYAFTAELKIGDSTFRGCARPDDGGKPAS